MWAVIGQFFSEHFVEIAHRTFIIAAISYGISVCFRWLLHVLTKWRDEKILKAAKNSVVPFSIIASFFNSHIFYRYDILPTRVLENGVWMPAWKIKYLNVETYFGEMFIYAMVAIFTWAVALVVIKIIEKKYKVKILRV